MRPLKLEFDGRCFFSNLPGTGRDRDTAADSNGHRDATSDTQPNAIADAFSDAEPDTGSNADTVAYAGSDTNSVSYADPLADAGPNAERNRQRHANR